MWSSVGRRKFTAHHSPFLAQNGKGVLRQRLMMLSSRMVCLDDFYWDDPVNSHEKEVAVSHSYSIAEAKSHLSTEVYRAETGEIWAHHTKGKGGSRSSFGRYL